MFGLLGPNGAGKTTTVEILEGYRARARPARCSVLGLDPASARPRAPAARRDRAPELRLLPARDGRTRRSSNREGVPAPARPATRRSRSWASTGRRTPRAKELSGGQRRRLDLALALVGDPELVFLDEPTTGFDPAARRTAWGVVRTLKELGKTVLLTTHYLDEAQELADRVAIVKDGLIVAEGPPDRARPGQRRLPGLVRSPAATAWSTRPTTRPSCSIASPATRSRAASGSRAWRSPGPRSKRSTSELTAEADSA